MYAVHKPQTYAEGQTAAERHITVQISIGTGIDSTAADDVTSITGDFLPMSNPEQLTDSNYILTDGLATFEADGIPSAVSAGMTVPPIQAEDYPPEAGVWSADISDADGLMDWTMTIALSQAHTSALSVYTADGVNVLQARIRYYSGDSMVREATIAPTDDVVQDTETTTYDRIEVTILKVDQPYRHVRIVEVEFGASITMSNSVIGDTVSLIRELDPLCMSAPISEVDFSLINVYGEYDADNPDTLIGQLAKWYPLEVSFTTVTDSGQVTVPMGRYYITDRTGTDTDLRITAQDARAILQSTVRPLTLSTTQSIGALYEALLTELGIPYVIDDDVYQVMPTADATMDAQEWDLLTQCVYIRQYYGVALTPGRDGFLHIEVDPASEQGTALTSETLTSWPTPVASQTYNCISVKYGQSSTYDVDLRTSPTEARSVLNVTNPLVTTQADAQRIAQEMQARLYQQEYTADAIGDAALDPGDLVPIDGRWTQDAPETYRLTSIGMTFDGALMMTVRGIRAPTTL